MRKETAKLTLLILGSVCLTLSMSEQSSAQPGNEKESAAARIEQLLEDGGPQEASAFFREMDRSEDGAFRFDEEEFISLAYRLLRSCDYESALVPFEIAVQLFPESWNAWDSLADCHRHLGNRELALKHYRRAAELNPQDESLPWRIRLIDRFITDNSAQTSAVERFAPSEQTGLKGPYLGQTPPGRTPELFAPGIVSTCTRYEYNPTFSPDGKLLYFSTNYGLFVCREMSAGWTAPEPAEISGFEPHITPDGDTMFIGRGLEIWAMDRGVGGWENDRKICEGMRPYTSADGTLYVTSVDYEREPSNLLAKLTPGDEGYGPVTLLPDLSNDSGDGAHPCVSADGNTMIFDSHRQAAEGNEFDDDLYISRRQADGSWSEARHLGFDINTAGSNFCASLSPDGKYLFYTANFDIYWVSVEGL